MVVGSETKAEARQGKRRVEPTLSLCGLRSSAPCRIERGVDPPRKEREKIVCLSAGLVCFRQGVVVLSFSLSLLLLLLLLGIRSPSRASIDHPRHSHPPCFLSFFPAHTQHAPCSTRAWDSSLVPTLLGPFKGGFFFFFGSDPISETAADVNARGRSRLCLCLCLCFIHFSFVRPSHSSP